MKINESAGWIAMWNGKKCEIKKDEAKDLWGAKQLAIRKLGVPKSRVGELTIDVAFEDDEDGVSNAQFEELKEEKEPSLPKEVTFKASEVALDTDDEDPSERLGDLLSDKYGFCHNGFKYEVKNNENGEPSEFRCYDIEWDTSESLKEEKDIEVKDIEKMTELEPGDEVEVTKEMDDVFDKSLEMAKEFDEEPKLETFDEQMDFLAKDEQEAIDGYEKVIALVEDSHVKEQLEKILVEEKAHKEFLEKVKEDKSLEYSHEEHEEEKVEEPVEVDTKVEIEKPEEEIIDDVFVDESYDDDFGFNHILDEEHKEEAIDWNDLDPEFEKVVMSADDEVLDDVFGKDTIERKVIKGARDIKKGLEKTEEKHVCEKCGKEVCECDKKIEEEHAHTGHIKAKKPIELLARVEK